MSIEVSYGPDSQTYFISRDSSHGRLAPTCDLWWLRPIRNKREEHVAWVSGDHPNNVSGHFGEFTVNQIRKWFGVIPETDRELVVCERNVAHTDTKAPPVTTPSPTSDWD